MVVKNNHTVPQFYLRNWSNDRRSVWCYDKVSNKVYKAPISKVAAESYFYLASDGDYLEKKISILEAHICPVINKICEQKTYANLTRDEEECLAFAISLQLVRTWSHRKGWSQIGTIMHRFLKDEGDHNSPHLQEFMLNSDECEYQEQLKDHSIKNLLSLSESLCPYILNKTWLIGLSSDNRLVTSDNPVVKQNDTEPKRIPLEDGGYMEDPTTGSLGVASLGIVINYPISPSCVLSFGCPTTYGCLSMSNGFQMTLTADNIVRENSMQLCYAERFVFAQNKETAQWIYDFAQSHPELTEKHIPSIRLGDRCLEKEYGDNL